MAMKFWWQWLTNDNLSDQSEAMFWNKRTAMKQELVCLAHRGEKLIFVTNSLDIMYVVIVTYFVLASILGLKIEVLSVNDS